MKSRHSPRPRAPGVSLVGALILLATAAPARATTIQIEPDDTYINLNATNYASDPQLNLYTWPSNKTANAILMKLDLSTLPASATISAATLHVTLVEADASADSVYTVTVHRIIHHNPVLSAATGMTYDGANAWTPSTCCDGGVPLAQADISAPQDTQSIDKVLGEKSFDVTGMLQAWQAAPAENFGLLLNSDATRVADRYRTFASSEAATATARPVVEVTYTEAGESAPGDPTPGGDGRAPADPLLTARSAHCGADQYYDYRAHACVTPADSSCAAAPPGWLASLVVLLALTLGVRRRHALGANTPTTPS